LEGKVMDVATVASWRVWVWGRMTFEAKVAYRPDDRDLGRFAAAAAEYVGGTWMRWEDFENDDGWLETDGEAVATYHPRRGVVTVVVPVEAVLTGDSATKPVRTAARYHWDNDVYGLDDDPDATIGWDNVELTLSSVQAEQTARDAYGDD
jgi:hypothetical protein